MTKRCGGQGFVVKVELHPEARRDFDEGFDWYAERSFEAAANFADEIDAILAKISASPARFAKIDKQHRHCIAHRFPYHVVYRVIDESIQVIAIAHGARRPGYWKDRS